MPYTIGTTVLDGWKIVRLIGEGGYGKVFEIEKNIDSYGLTARSALKVIQIPQSQADIRSALSEGMDEHTVTSQFRSYVDEIVHEIAVMSTLKSHPNIVSYEDHLIREYPGEIRWDILIRMELLTPLIEYQMAHPLNHAEILRMGRELCDALAFCQRKGLLHRDIKPENIFVSETGQFKLGDFGVSRTVEKTAGGMSKKGTESYMAPEVYLGQPYGSTVDIYSLGLVLYRFYNGNRLPFLPPAPHPISFSDRENALIRRTRGDAFPPPAKADERMAAIILKACAYQSQDRYRSAAEMAQALEAYAGRPTEGFYGTSNVDPAVNINPDGGQAEQSEDRTVGAWSARAQSDPIKEADTIQDSDRTVGAWGTGVQHDSTNGGVGGGTRANRTSPFTREPSSSSEEADPLDVTFGAWGRGRDTQSDGATESTQEKKTPELNVETFWRGRLEQIATKFIPLVYYRPSIPEKHLQKAMKAAPKMMKICGDIGLRGTSDLRPGPIGQQGTWNVTEQSILGMICADIKIAATYSTNSSTRLFVTKEALYIHSGMKSGFLALGYRNIADAKVVQDVGFGHQKLKVLLKDGSIHLCSLDSGVYDWLRFDKLVEALLELRKYYK